MKSHWPLPRNPCICVVMNGGEKDKHLLEDQDGRHLTLFARLRGYFLAGILVTAPIGLTVFLTWMFLRFIDDRVTALIPEAYNPFNYLPTIWPGLELVKSLLSLVLVIVFFISAGWFARNFLGRLLYQLAEYIVDRMPVIRNIYGALKQIFETIMASQSQAFRDVVMFQYPRPGIWAIGFVTGVTKGEVQRLTDNEVVNVFLPTTPNPTSGFLLFLPRKDLTVLNMTVEEGIKMIVSGGIITPPDTAEHAEAVKEKKPATSLRSKKKPSAKKASSDKKS